jgi:thiol:disulfide interchange protein DsbA
LSRRVALIASTGGALAGDQRVGIEGTPTVVINGKYRVLGKSREDELRIADQLITQELAAIGAK